MSVPIKSDEGASLHWLQ